eukprot:TRINITY_DN7055_c0_g1_i1.p1 TRINITY_DN7055_c0_g1~~TRINITY_DN7055_c0_g1_i1.p1  ORF type:complete len:783 (-),score=131.78 TRINITY_DN7055_c0_g1_i1:1132-3480(-)
METLEATIEEAIRLANVLDPIETPYASKYRSNAVLLDTRNLLLELDQNRTTINNMGRVEHLLGVNYVKIEEYYNGEKYLSKALTKLNCNKEVYTKQVLDILNHLGIIWLSRDNLELGLSYLTQSETLYNEYCTNHPGSNDLDAEYILTNYILAQIHGKKSDVELSAYYCHKTLKLQYTSGTYDPPEFSKNCVLLSQFYLEQSNIHMAAYCITVASYIYNRTAKHLPDINRAWGRCYSKHLELFSKNEVVESDIAIDSLGINVSIPEFSSTVDKLQADEYSKIGIDFLNRSIEYYVIEGFASTHIEILLDIIQIYNWMLDYEENNFKRCEYYLHCIDLIEPLIGQLNISHFLAIIRRIEYTCGELYNALVMDLWELISIEDPDPIFAALINFSIEKSIYHYNMYIDSYPLNDHIIVEELEEILTAQLNIAEIHTKYYSTSLTDVVQHLENGLVHYCDIDIPEIANRFDFELQLQLQLIDEHKNLLRNNIEQIQNSIIKIGNTEVSTKKGVSKQMILDTFDQYSKFYMGDQESYVLFYNTIKPYITPNLSNLRLFVCNHDLSPLDLDNQVENVRKFSVQVVRNLRNWRFPSCMNNNDRREVELLFKDILLENLDGKYLPINAINNIPNHFNELLRYKNIKPNNDYFTNFPRSRGVWINEDRDVYILINHKDHVKIKAIGDNIEHIYNKVINILTLFSGLKFAHIPSLGYLASNPNNCGNAMKLAATMDPKHVTNAIVAQGNIKLITDKLECKVSTVNVIGLYTEKELVNYFVSQLIAIQGSICL